MYKSSIELTYIITKSRPSSVSYKSRTSALDRFMFCAYRRILSWRYYVGNLLAAKNFKRISEICCFSSFTAATTIPDRPFFLRACAKIKVHLLLKPHLSHQGIWSPEPLLWSYSLPKLFNRMDLEWMQRTILFFQTELVQLVQLAAGAANDSWSQLISNWRSLGPNPRAQETLM